MCHHLLYKDIFGKTECAKVESDAIAYANVLNIAVNAKNKDKIAGFGDKNGCVYVRVLDPRLTIEEYKDSLPPKAPKKLKQEKMNIMLRE